MKFKGMIATDMSGSMDGVTASSNTHGSYFKKRSRPSQPNSAAQLRAKSAFARAASIFRTLTGAAIAGWNNFAKTIFSPKNATNTGQFSGQNAHQALSVAFNNAIGLDKAFTVEVNGAVAAGGTTFEAYEGPALLPPIAGGSTNLALTAGGSTPLTLISATMNATGICSFKVQVGAGGGLDITGMQNASGNDMGFAIVMSNGNPSANMNFANPERYQVAYLKHIDFTDPADVAAIADFELTLTDGFVLGEYKTFPAVGEIVEIGIYAVTKACQLNLLGRVPVQIAA